jgi:hypothetical protein
VKYFVLFLSKNRQSGRVVSAVLVIVIVAVALVLVAYYTGFNFSSLSKPPTLPAPLVSVARNWAGYEVATNFLSPSSAVQAVSATWTVPTVTNTSSDAYSSVWVGVGGQFEKALIQVGTEQDFTGVSAKYYAWYEMLPSNQVIISSIQVSPGDQIEASVSLANSNSSLWSISIEDLTSNGKFQNDYTYDSKQSTGEWIVEEPEVNNALANLADFGSVAFTNCQANLSGQTGGITAFSSQAVFLGPNIENGRSVQLVSVSSPTNGGTQFKVTYEAT